MKATELRIGNLVQGGTITEIGKDYFKYFDGYATWNSITQVENLPIPLTEEWLVKFGFKEYIDFGRHTGIWDLRPLQGFSYDLSDNKVMIMNKGNSQSHWLHDNKIEHVHSLQNLYFALTGEELLAK